MKVLSSMKPVIPDWGRAYPQLRRYLAGVYGKAWESGVRYMITLTPDDMGVGNFFASYMVSVLPAASSGEPDDEYDAIVTMLTNERQILRDGEELSVERLTLPNFPLAVQAPSIRFVVTDEGAVTNHKVAMLRIFIPFDNRVIVVTGITPQIHIADVMFTLFVRITETLEARVSSASESGEGE